MLASVVLWFSSYNEVMTSDKFVYLFGRVIPALSLVLSMSLRFIPKFKAQMQIGQRSAGVHRAEIRKTEASSAASGTPSRSSPS